MLLEMRDVTKSFGATRAWTAFRCKSTRVKSVP